MFLHWWISVRLMVASVVDMVWCWRWRRYNDVRGRVRRRVRIRRRVMFGRTRVGIRRLIWTWRRGRMVRQLTGRR